MPRINIEEEWFTDPRRERLAELLGSKFEADGLAVYVWRFAQKYWMKKELIPLHAWYGAGFGDHLFECGLAEKRENGVYVRGSKRHFEWYHTKLAQLTAGAQIGGKMRAKSAHRNQNGSFKSNITQPEASREPAESSGEPAESSPSSSSSSSKELKTIAQTSSRLTENPDFKENYVAWFDAAYKIYPRKRGKSRGLAIFKKQIKTEADFKKILTAIKNYSQTCERESRKLEYTLQFDSFMRQWTDWLSVEISHFEIPALDFKFENKGF